MKNLLKDSSFFLAQQANSPQFSRERRNATGWRWQTEE